MTAHEGLLDGVTLYRFAHMMRWSTSGGVENYLFHLNNLLLQRNKMRILQTFLSPPGAKDEVVTEKIGRGELIWIPSFISYETLDFWGRLRRARATRKMRCRTAFKIDHRLLTEMLSSFDVSLGVFHWLSKDCRSVLDDLVSRAVPVCILNHFANAYLESHLAKRCALKCVGVGGVTGVEAPAFLGDKFTTLLDGINVSFFDPARAQPSISRASLS